MLSASLCKSSVYKKNEQEILSKEWNRIWLAKMKQKW